MFAQHPTASEQSGRERERGPPLFGISDLVFDVVLAEGDTESESGVVCVRIYRE